MEIVDFKKRNIHNIDFKTLYMTALKRGKYLIPSTRWKGCQEYIKLVTGGKIRGFKKSLMTTTRYFRTFKIPVQTVYVEILSSIGVTDTYSAKYFGFSDKNLPDAFFLLHILAFFSPQHPISIIFTNINLNFGETEDEVINEGLIMATKFDSSPIEMKLTPDEIKIIKGFNDLQETLYKVRDFRDLSVSANDQYRICANDVKVREFIPKVIHDLFITPDNHHLVPELKNFELLKLNSTGNGNLNNNLNFM